MSAAVLHDTLPARGVDRRFWALIGLSLLFHGALFAGMAWQRKALPVPLPTLMATLRLIAPSEANPEPRPVAASAPAPAAAVPPKARQQVAAAEQRTAPRVTQPAGPANVPAQTRAPAVVAEAAPQTVPAVAATASVAPAEAAPPVRPQGDVLAAYRQHLTELFARGYEYPRIAALRGWEGEVRLRLKVARRGNLLGIALDRSSGFDVLDQHAQSLLASYGDLPPLPEALEASEIQVIVPINYKLRKTT